MNTDIERSIGDIARSVLRRTVSCFSDDDTLVVKEAHPNIRVVYSPARASGGPSDPTMIRLCLRRDTAEMWIGSLHVAVPFRSKGLGRQLVQAAEEFARAAGVAIVNVLPLYSSHPFWAKMGYRSHPCTSRVLSKHVPTEGSEQKLAAPSCGSGM